VPAAIPGGEPRERRYRWLDRGAPSGCEYVIEELEANPHPNFHVFRSDQPLNPRKSKKIVGALEDVFGRLDSTRHYVAAEMGNQWSRKGEDFVTKADVDRCTDKRLQNSSGTSEPAVGFLDTSMSVEKTSLTILASDSLISETLWDHLYQAWLAYWIPQGKAIPTGEVLDMVDAVVPIFTGLRCLWVDVQGMPWAADMVSEIKRSRRPWKDKIKSWSKRRDERAAGWMLLQQRMLSHPPTIRLQDDKEQRKEWAGIRLQPGRSGMGVQVVDRDRRKIHKDLTENLAVCCYLANNEKTKIGFGTMAKIAGNNKAPSGKLASGIRPAALRAGGLTGKIGTNSF